MIERVVGLSTKKAFEELRNLLLKSKCKITAEEHPKSITVEQGSLWGVSPKGAKKTVNFHLIPKDSETRMVSTASLTSDWIAISVFTYVFSGILSPLFWLFAIDIESSIYVYESSMANLLKFLSIFFAIIVVIGIVFDVYIYAKRDSFAEETLRLLP